MTFPFLLHILRKIKSWEEKSNQSDNLQRVPDDEKEREWIDETSLGAAYGSKLLFSDAMTSVHVIELEYDLYSMRLIW